MSSRLPPIPQKAPLTDINGMVSQVWGAWLRSLFIRVGSGDALTNNELALLNGDGSQIYSGVGAPSGATGNVGDWYFNTSGGAGRGDVYNKTGPGTWTLEFNTVGATGATGAIGPAGADGIDGEDGVTPDLDFAVSSIDGYIYTSSADGSAYTLEFT